MLLTSCFATMTHSLSHTQAHIRMHTHAYRHIHSHTRFLSFSWHKRWLSLNTYTKLHMYSHPFIDSYIPLSLSLSLTHTHTHTHAHTQPHLTPAHKRTHPHTLTHTHLAMAVAHVRWQRNSSKLAWNYTEKNRLTLEKCSVMFAHDFIVEPIKVVGSNPCSDPIKNLKVEFGSLLELTNKKQLHDSLFATSLTQHHL